VPVASYAALHEAYTHLLKYGVEIQRAADHVWQRSIYFADPDGNCLALELFPDGLGDEDEVLPLSSADDPLPQWLMEEWPGRDGEGRTAAPPGSSRGSRLTSPAKRLERSEQRFAIIAWSSAQVRL
jgi:hypothetical protein